MKNFKITLYHTIDGVILTKKMTDKKQKSYKWLKRVAKHISGYEDLTAREYLNMLKTISDEVGEMRKSNKFCYSFRLAQWIISVQQY